MSHREIMTYEEILRLCKISVRFGIQKIKITGGEPLIRRDVCQLIARIRQIPMIKSVTMTTNGSLLKQYLPELKQAGLTGINISLDTLNRERFCQITKRDSFEQVWDGIRKAIMSGIPVKINCIPMRGWNEDELAEIAGLAKQYPITVRFIEMMPIGMGTGQEGIFQDEIRERLSERYGDMLPVNEVMGNGPASYYNLSGFQGRIGFISAVTHEFCGTCNRIRLTADGILKPCLNYESQINLKEKMRDGVTDQELEKIVKDCIYAKPRCHAFGDQTKKKLQEKRRMVGIGG